MELNKVCSLITKCITSISLMIIAVSMIMYCSQMSNTKIKDGLMFNIDAFVCKGDACEYHVKGTIETHGDKVKYEEVNPNVH